MAWCVMPLYICHDSGMRLSAKDFRSPKRIFGGGWRNCARLRFSETRANGGDWLQAIPYLRFETKLTALRLRLQGLARGPRLHCCHSPARSGLVLFTAAVPLLIVVRPVSTMALILLRSVLSASCKQHTLSLTFLVLLYFLSPS